MSLILHSLCRRVSVVKLCKLFNHRETETRRSEIKRERFGASPCGEKDPRRSSDPGGGGRSLASRSKMEADPSARGKDAPAGTRETRAGPPGPPQRLTAGPAVRPYLESKTAVQTQPRIPRIATDETADLNHASAIRVILNSAVQFNH